MSDELTGKQFGGALEELRRAGRVNLPELADLYSTAAGKLANTHDGLKSALTREENLSSGSSEYSFKSHGYMYESWVQLRDILESAFCDSSKNFWSIGETIGWAVDAFAEEDTKAAEYMDKEKAELGANPWATEHSDSFEPPKGPEWSGPS